MKKVKTAAALLCSACLVLSGTAVPTMADSVKVVTLGADLTQDQKNTILRMRKRTQNLMVWKIQSSLWARQKKCCRESIRKMVFMQMLSS